VRTLRLRGGNAAFWDARDKEILVEGPRGTGKTRTILELIDALCRNFPGLAVLLVRKYRASLAGSCVKTFEEQVKRRDVVFFGGSERELAGYRYPNGSKITLGGMDDPEKVKSTEYDVIYWNEATEGTEEEWMSLLPLLRHMGPDGEAIIEHRRLIGDCNPAHDKHWLIKRHREGLLRWIKTTIRDNPLYANGDGTLTPEGEEYLNVTLGNLTGTKRQQWIDGLWIGMENAIYSQLERAKQVQPLPVAFLPGGGAIGVDYGDIHPSAVVAIQRDNGSGAYWVRECWAGHDETDLKVAVRSMRVRYRINRGRADPNQAFLAHTLGFNVAKRGNNTRKERIDHVAALMNANALYFDLNGAGVEELFDEMLTYRWEKRETATVEELVPVRIDDDRVAALEYAIEELVTSEGFSVPSSVQMQRGQTARRPGLGVTKARA